MATRWVLRLTGFHSKAAVPARSKRGKLPRPIACGTHSEWCPLLLRC
jgi:hypothetical protein